MTPAFVVYNKLTGSVLRAGICVAGCESDQVNDLETEDYLCVDQVLDPNLYSVIDGALAPKEL